MKNDMGLLPVPDSDSACSNMKVSHDGTTFIGFYISNTALS